LIAHEVAEKDFIEAVILALWLSPNLEDEVFISGSVGPKAMSDPQLISLGESVGG
jgi:hypothetical protein